MTPVCLIDGMPETRIAADNRGLAYGDGVFRTLLVADGRALHLDDHLAKLADDAARLELAMPADAQLCADSQQALDLAGAPRCAVLKWTLLRRSEGRGYASATTAALRIVAVTPAPRYAGDLWRHGARAELSDVCLAPQPRLAGVKHLNRLEQVLASRRWPRGVDEKLMCDDAGHLVAGTRTNLFWGNRRQLWTPRLDRCGVAGTMRARVMRIAAALGLSLTEALASPADVLGADEVFVCNALIGIWPLRQIADRNFNVPGPLTQQLMTALAHPRLN